MEQLYQLSDLVRDFKLETRFLSDTETVHEYAARQPSSRSERWKRVEQLGFGGFGRVFLERCVADHQNVPKLRAVKEIKVDLARKIDYSRELEATMKFSLQKYETCFVKSFGWYERPGYIFIAMEYLPLGDLEKYLKEKHQRPLPEDEVQVIIRQIVQGLTFMHENQFAHRDLKPQNILLKSHPPDEWCVKIADFGISKRIRDDYQISVPVGTPGYMAPEMHNSTESGSPYALDIWAVGEIAHKMLTGQPTFETMDWLKGFTRQLLPFPKGRLSDTDVSQSGIEFIVSAMHPAPTRRITAQEALNHHWIRGSLLGRNGVDSTRYTGADSVPTATDTQASATWSFLPKQSELLRETDSCRTGSTPDQHGEAARVKRTIFGADEMQREAIWGISNDPTASTLHVSDEQSITGAAVPNEEQGVAEVTAPHAHEMQSESLHDTNNHPTAVSDIPERSPRMEIALGRDDIYAGSALNMPGEQGATGISVPHTHTADFAVDSAVQFAPNGKLLAAVSRTNPRLWNPVTDELYQVPIRYVSSVNFGSVSSSQSDLLGAMSITDGSSERRKPSVGLKHATPNGYWFLDERNKKLAISPDGKLIALASCDTHIIRIWDVDTNKLHSMLHGHLGSVSAIAFSPDGRLIASASSDRSVCLWSVNTGEPHLILKDHPLSVTGVMFSPDGKLVASLSGATIMLWDSQTGDLRHTLKDHSFFVTGATFTTDGRGIASTFNGTVQVWDVALGTLVTTLKGGLPKPSVTAVAFSPDGKLIASFSGIDVILWNAATGKVRATMNCSHFRLSGMAFSPDCKKLVLSSSEGAFRLWDLTTSTVRSFFKGRWFLLGWTKRVTISSGTKWVASISGTTVLLRDYNMGSARFTLEHSHTVTTVVLSSDGSLVASASNDGGIRVWSAETGGVIRELGGNSPSVSALEFSSNNQFLASASAGVVHLWNIQEGTLHAKLKDSRLWPGRVKDVAMSPNDKLLATAITTATGRIIRVWDLETKAVRATLSVRSGSVVAVVFAPDSKHLASICDKEILVIWDLQTEKVCNRVKDGSFWANGVVFSPDGELVASSSPDGHLNLWGCGT